MEHSTLRVRSILVVKGELLAMEIVQALDQAGANVTMTTAVRHALLLIEHDGVSAAIVDIALSDADRSELCAQLNARGISYAVYRGFDPVKETRAGSPETNDPASADAFMVTIEKLLEGSTRSF